MCENNINVKEDVIFPKGSRSSEGYEEQGLTHDEIWDDQALIQHYDEALKKAKLQLACKLNSGTSVSDSDCSANQRMDGINGYGNANHHHNSHSKKKKKKKKSREKNEWHTGDPCRAVYAEDGKTYEATIIGLDNTCGMCHVRFLGYNNDEHVSLSSLLKSKGEGARRRQLKEAAENVTQSEADDSYATESDMVTEDDCDAKKPPSVHSTNKTGNHRHNHSIPHLPLLPPPPALGLVDSNDPVSSEALHTMLMSWYMTGYHTGYYQGLQQCRRPVQPQRSCDKNSQHIHKNK